MLFSKRDKNVTRHKQLLSILNSRLAMIKPFQAPVMNANMRCIFNASSKFSIQFYSRPIYLQLLISECSFRFYGQTEACDFFFTCIISNQRTHRSFPWIFAIIVATSLFHQRRIA